MAKGKVSVSRPKIKGQENLKNITSAFYEASRISFSLVFFPVAILLFGVWLDKKFTTTPLFIILGIVFGVTIGLYKATRIRKSETLKNG
jgi:F0F1-type ATP synthase assembly protein I